MSQLVGGENVPWRISEANTEYGMCETYPKVLGVPAAINDENLVAASQFRSKGRMPVSNISLWYILRVYVYVHSIHLVHF